METHAEKMNNRSRNILLAVSSIFLFIALFCFIFHISPKELSHQLANFAKHHYFLTGFICLVVSIVSFKYYHHQPASTDNSKTIVPVGRIRSKRRRLKVMLQNLKRSLDASNDKKSIFINKSEIAGMKFGSSEVLRHLDDMEARKRDLKNALALGNLYKQKVIIIFDDKGIKRHTLATVWHLDDENVGLKGGTFIPIRTIYKVDL